MCERLKIVIVIDGAEGEGGGQVLRNALALSLVTGKPFRIDNIRGGRTKPGLMRQHVTAIEAACAVGSAQCEGLAVGASTIVFHPGRVVVGDHRFAVGTAGSTGLVLQAVLSPLMLAAAPSRLVIEGGTHASHAPPFEFIAATLLPLLERLGPKFRARLVRHGFYPVGGGRIEIEIEPAVRLVPIDFLERGALRSLRARAIVASLPRAIAEREIASLRTEFDWPEETFSVETLSDDHGPGNVVLLEAAFEHVTEIVSGFGKIGLSAETIGRQVAGRMNGYLATDAFAGPYLADQILLPIALAGKGSFTTVKPSAHSHTAASVIRRFLDLDISFSQRADGSHLVTVS
jgi:RNA 3'-terminal phosphate cyclase (ATP)